MKGLIILVFVLFALVLLGCSKAPDEGAATGGDSGFVKKEAPEVCDALTEEFLHVRDDYSEKPIDIGFLRMKNKLGGGYSYTGTSSDCSGFECFMCSMKAVNNTEYFYCNDVEFSKHDRDTDDEGNFIQDEETFYVIEDMVLEFKDIYIEYSGYAKVKAGELYRVVSRACYQTGYKNYLEQTE